MILHKNYSGFDLQNIFGPNWAYILQLHPVPKIFNKPVINDFTEFDLDTKQKYLLIAKNIKDSNETNINVWASGSRIAGCWKTKEEAEFLALKYNKSKPKYSDYDFITDAKIIPNLNHLGFSCHGFQIINANQHKVLIPKELY